jgi:KTSC domain
MDRLLVNSSNLVSVGYNAAECTLEVEFQSGNIYKYFFVPESVYQGLMTTGSKGEYFHDNILKVYDYQEA